MKNLLWVALLLVSTAGLCQSHGSVFGSVLDREMNEEPLMFANVELQNTEWHTQTNLSGNFEIVGVTPGNYTLAISFSGYQTKTVPIKVEENNTVDVLESLSAKAIDVGAFTESVDAEAQTSNNRIYELDNSLRR
ncbi:MAG: carboxypeptidase-like regulatory domain-containing protein [Pricia sp.]